MELIDTIKNALTKITQGRWVHYSGKLRKEFPTKINEIQTASGETVVPWTGFDSCSVSKKEISHNAHFIANAPAWLSSLITTIESQKEEIDFALKTLNEIYDLRPSTDENYLHTLNGCQHKAKHASNEIEWRRRNAK